MKIAFLAITHQPAISDFSFRHVAFVGMPAQEIRHITFPMSDFSDILYEEAERHVDKGYMTKTATFLKSKMADGHHFVNRKIATSQ